MKARLAAMEAEAAKLREVRNLFCFTWLKQVECMQTSGIQEKLLCKVTEHRM